MTRLTVSAPLRAGIAGLLIVSCLASRAHSDTSSGAPGVVALVVVAASASAFANVVRIAEGDGSPAWGVLGLGLGIFGLTLDNDDIDVPAGVVGGLGLASLIMSFGRNGEEAGAVQFAPALLTSPGDRVAPGIRMTIDF